MNRFAGKTAVVTGGASGIGRATVSRLLDEGARVAVLDQRPAGAPRHVNCHASAVDVRSETEVQNAFEAIGERWGRLDMLVNAAGIELVAPVEETGESQWDKVIDTNLKGCYLAIRAALPLLRASRGAIVNVASQLALVGANHFAAYTASKAAVLGLTRSVALEVARDGVRVNAVCPGAVDTPLLQRQFADGKRGPQGTIGDLVSMHPVGRLGAPDEIAGPIVFLLSEEASFITGSSMVVDGGYTSW